MEGVGVTDGWFFVALFSVLGVAAASWFYRGQKAPGRLSLVGLLPVLIYSYNDIYEWVTQMLILGGGTITYRKGAWTKWVVTADPTNVEYVLKIKFHNFVKGDYFRQVFGDVYGDMAILLQEGETWRQLRATASTIFATAKTRNDVIQTTLRLVHQRLIPLFQRAAKEGIVLDLQEVFHRYTFDSISNFALGFDPGSLSLDLAHNRFSEAYDQAIELSMRRFLMPALYWKTLRFLNLGPERQIRKDVKVIDDYIAEICATTRRKIAQNSANCEDSPGFLPLLLRLEKETNGRVYSDDQLRDACVSIIMAGRDTTAPALAWFFWLLQQHPRVEENILTELKGIINRRKHETHADHEEAFTVDELKEMNYLHAALSESLRLYPSAALENLVVANDDVLPDGTRVNKGSGVLCLWYSMARMESIWGADCRDFKPERWLHNGKFMTKSEFIYPVFNEGPRRCLGRDVAHLQMKWVASSIILRFRVKAVAAHPVVPKYGMMLRMKLGLKVTVVSR